VCTGSLMLAAAGLLDGRRATTHWLALKQLSRYGATPTREQVVFDGYYVTAAGVSAGIDMALHLTASIAGEAAAQSRRLSIEYDRQPRSMPDRRRKHLQRSSRPCAGAAPRYSVEALPNPRSERVVRRRAHVLWRMNRCPGLQALYDP
jgi:transcriptional regulator GlxA family with amidase domain